jgi:hypothetical protein
LVRFFCSLCNQIIQVPLLKLLLLLLFHASSSNYAIRIANNVAGAYKGSDGWQTSKYPQTVGRATAPPTPNRRDIVRKRRTGSSRIRTRKILPLKHRDLVAHKLQCGLAIFAHNYVLKIPTIQSSPMQCSLSIIHILSDNWIDYAESNW